MFGDSVVVCLVVSQFRRMVAVLSCAAIMLGSLSAQKSIAVPHLVKFSGTISGSASGSIGVIFALYKDQTGGAPLWQEVQNVTMAASGHYTALLGAGSAAGIPVELFSSNEARWLGVQAQGQAEQARVLLVSVPYALKASDSETLGGLPASAFVRADAGTAATAPAVVTGSVNTAAVQTSLSRAVANISASGTSGYLPVFTDIFGDLGNSALSQVNAGTVANPIWNVGLGSAAPAFNLNIISQVDPAAVSVDGYGIVGVNYIGRRARGTLAAPSAILAGDNIMAMQGRGYGTTGFSGGSRANMKFFAAENWSDSAQGTYISLSTTPKGGNSAAERVRIADNGNVGVGTTTPTSALTVAGAVQSTSGGFVFPDGTVQATAQAANLTTISTQLGSSGYNGANFTYGGSASGINCYLGDIVLSVNAYGGANSMAIPADGRLLPINQNQALFTILGTRFGGDGVTTFAVPDMRPFTPQGLQYSMCIYGFFPSRN